jgi:uncharacterized repeat protein (TIGR02543 family)
MNTLPGRSGTARSFLFKPPVFLCLLALAAGLLYTACSQPAEPASWSYKVSFHLNDGTGDLLIIWQVNSPATTVGTLPVSPSRDAYTFTGWNTQADGGGMAFTENTPVTGDISVYAQWQPVSPGFFAVIFDKNGGDTEASPAYQTVSSPATTVGTLPAPPTRSGHTFTGWNTVSGGSGTAFTETTPVTANITVYAQWQLIPPPVITYTVTFDKNSGDTEANPAFITVSSPATTVGTLPAPPSRSGYTFIGWNTVSGGSGTAFTETTPVTVDITVYAQWQPVLPGFFAVIFDKNGGDTEASPAYQTVSSPATTVGTLPAPPTRIGHTFTGWNTVSGGGGTAFIASTPVTANITVYAQWQINAWAVTFDKNGGDTEANPTSKIVTYPSTTVGTLPAPPTRTGHTFTGWNTVSGGSGTAFIASTPVTANITVYAQWQPNAWTVTFDKNGGDTEATPASKTVTYPVTTVGTLPAPPTRNGHTFTGWNAVSGGGGTAFIASTPVTANITVYAQWQPNSWTVTFDKNGGDTEANPISKTVTYPATTVGTLPAPPTRNGHTFTGWNTVSGGGGTAFIASTPVTANITVYAQWQINAWTVTFDKNGGDTEANPSSKTVSFPATTVGTLPAPPSRSGYTFIGWNTVSGGGGIAFTASTPVTADITVYAQWSAGGASRNITLTFSDQGTGAFSQNTFTVQKGGTPASVGISLTGGWTGGDWLVDGESRGSGTGFTVNATDYAVGGHTLQVLVHDGTKYWSKTISFTVTAAVTGITLNPGELRLPVGGTATLAAGIIPANAANQGKNWSSDNPTIATVSSGGVVSGVVAGTTIIRVASAENPSIQTSCTVTVEAAQDITLGFTDWGAGAFSQDTFTVWKGGTPASVGISLTGSWAGGDWLVDGEIRGSGTGFTVNASDYAVGGHTLQALVFDGTKYWSKTIPFTVTAAVTGISLNRSDLWLPVGGTAALIAGIIPANAANQGKNWSSDDPAIAAVSSGGVVSGVVAGTTTIRVASAENPSLQTFCTVTVEAAQTITLTFTDQGAGAFNQNTFTVRKGGTPASVGISLTGSWTTGDWLVDGESRGSGTGFTVNAADYAVGGHTLQALVFDGTKYWSRTISFTVSN